MNKWIDKHLGPVVGPVLVGVVLLVGVPLAAIIALVAWAL